MPDPQPVPINAKFDDDFVTQLVLVLDTDTMREVAAKVAHHVVGKRLPKRDADMVVRYQGRDLSPDITVAVAGIAPLQNVYVDWVEKGVKP
jgi:toluene monooxygenase system protein B